MKIIWNIFIYMVFYCISLMVNEQEMRYMRDTLVQLFINPTTLQILIPIWEL